MSTRSILLQSLTCGALLALLTMSFPYPYCEFGYGRGLPFAAYCPSCGATFAALGVDETQCTQVLDLAKLAGNVLLWSGIVAGFQGWWRRRQQSPLAPARFARRTPLRMRGC